MGRRQDRSLTSVVGAGGRLLPQAGRKACQAWRLQRSRESKLRPSHSLTPR